MNHTHQAIADIATALVDMQIPDRGQKREIFVASLELLVNLAIAEHETTTVRCVSEDLARVDEILENARRVA